MSVHVYGCRLDQSQFLLASMALSYKCVHVMSMALVHVVVSSEGRQNTQFINSKRKLL